MPAPSDARERVEPLRRVLRDMTAPADPRLVDAFADGSVRCHACAHRCLVRPDREGVCRVRFNDAGTLRVPHGYVAALATDPIEKKPFFHVLPGSRVLTFGMLGCDLHCGYCQNWLTSQTLRDPDAVAPAKPVSARRIVEDAVAAGAAAVASSYNEPLITAEWAVEIFRQASRHGLLRAFVSNGHATPRVLGYLRPHVEAFKVDLKSFDDAGYRELGGVLGHVLDSIRRMRAMGFWVEIVTLLVPGFNDSADALQRMGAFLAAVDPRMPWHLTAFHPEYRMAARRATTADDLARAAELARGCGMRYVYAGNRPGEVAGGEDTRCEGCGMALIRRRGFVVLEQRIDETGQCPRCRALIPGVWRR